MYILGLIDLPWWLLVILSILSVPLFIYLYGKRKHSFFDNLGVPTLKKNVFFFGDLPIVKEKGFGYLDYDVIKENGKVFGIYLGNMPSLVVCDTELIKEITVKQFNKFTDRKNVVPSHERWNSALNIAGGHHWKFLRTTLSPTFSSGKMRNMTGIIQVCLENLCELIDQKIKDNPEGFDMAPLVQGLTMDVICNAGFGIEVNAQSNPDNTFVHHAKQFLQIQPLRMPVFLANLIFPDLKPILLRFFPSNIIPSDTFEYMKNATMSVFAERKKTDSQHKDLLQLMINAHKGEDNSKEVDYTYDEFKRRGLTDEEVLANSIVFMSAGYETTASALAWFTYDMVIHPDIQRKLAEEIDAEIGDAAPTYDNVFKLCYLDMVMNETLRMHPPATRFNRVPVEDVEINGIKFPKGMGITFTPLALHFMPEYWENPNEYNPERFAPENQANIDQYAFMPFGHGPRSCVAKRLAHLELKMTMVKLIQRYQLIKTDSLHVPMPIAIAGTLKAKYPIQIKAKLRQKS